MDIKDKNLLSAVLDIETTTPFPETTWDESHPENKPKIVPSPTRKVTLRVCSEFQEHLATIENFYSLNKLVYLTDDQGQPLILSIDTNSRLQIIAHVDGGPHAWQQIDITPDASGSKVSAFGSTRSPGKLHVVAAIENGATSKLYHATVAIPSLHWNAKARKVEPDLISSFSWQETVYNEGAKMISSISCGRSKAPFTKSSPFSISVGTAATGDRVASFFLVDPSSDDSAPWRSYPLPINADKVLSIEGAITRAGTGSFQLFESQGKTGVVQKCMDTDGSWLQDVTVPTRGEVSLGKAHQLCACTNISGQTDLYVASEHGIGFFEARNVSSSPKIIMQGLSFVQAIANETIHPNYPTNQTSVITIAAVSEDGELYSITGVRDIATNKVEFSASGLPIRTNVRDMACVFNKQRRSHEIVYASTTTSVLKHLALDPETECWNEYAVALQAPETKPRPFPAYISTLTVVDRDGASVGEDYPLELNGETALISVNSRAFILDHRPKRALTDRHGKINIVVATDSALSAPEIKVRLSQFGSQEEHHIYVAQRVMNRMNQVKSSSDLIGAKSTTGKDVFKSHIADKKFVQAMDGVADVLSSFPHYMAAISKDATNLVLKEAHDAVDQLEKIWEKDESGVRKSSDRSFIDEIGDVIHKIGDTLEWLKNKVKGIVKGLVRFAVRIVGQAVDFVIKIGTKIVRFVVSKVGGLIKTLANFMKEYLGIDISEFLDWFGLVFDVSEVKMTQQVLIKFVSTLRSNIHTFNTNNGKLIENAMDSVTETIKKSIGVHPPKRQPVDLKGLEMFGWLLDNPILEKIKSWSPFFWIMDAEKEGLLEGIGDLIQTPDFSILWNAATGVVTDVVESTLISLWQIISDLWDKIKVVYDSPEKASDAALDFFKDTIVIMMEQVKHLVSGMMEIVTAAVEQTFEILMGKWHIPLLTTLFEVYADQEFSLLNVITFGVAQVMHIFFQATQKKKPFEVLGDPMAFFHGWTNDTLDMHSVLGIAKPPALQPTTAVDTFAGSSSNEPVRLMAFASFKLPAMNPPRDLPADVKLPDGWPRDQEEYDYLNVKNYHNRVESMLGGIVALGAIASSAIGIAAYKGATKNEIPRKPGPNDVQKIEIRELAKQNQARQALVGMSTVGSAIAMIGRACQLIAFNRACAQSSRLEKEWLGDDSLGGYITPVVTNAVATFIHVVNCLSFSNEAVTIIGNVLMKAGDLSQYICFRLVHDPPEEQKVLDMWVNKKVSGGIRIFSDATGMVCDVASYWKDTEPGAIATGVTGGLSLTSLGFTVAIENHDVIKMTNEFQTLGLLQ